MNLILYCGLCLIASGLTAIAQLLGAPAFVGTQKPAPPVLLGLGILSGGLGVVLIWAVLRVKARVKVQWSEYAQRAMDCATAFKSNGHVHLPQRPMPVSDTLIDFTTTQALSPNEVQHLSTARFVEAMAALLQPCGESRTYLGSADAIVFRERKESQPPSAAERLPGAWVVDREWDDGRWTTEWLLAQPAGSRIRLIGGGTLVGRFSLGRPNHPVDKWGIPILTALIICAASFFTSGFVWFWIPAATALWIALQVRFPTWRKTCGVTLAVFTIPGIDSALRKSLESEHSALRTRVVEAIAELESLSARKA